MVVTGVLIGLIYWKVVKSGLIVEITNKRPWIFNFYNLCFYRNTFRSLYFSSLKKDGVAMHDVPPKSILRDKVEAGQIDVNTAFGKFLRWELAATAGSAVRGKFHHTMAHSPNMGCKHVG